MTKRTPRCAGFRGSRLHRRMEKGNSLNQKALEMSPHVTYEQSPLLPTQAGPTYVVVERKRRGIGTRDMLLMALVALIGWHTLVVPMHSRWRWGSELERTGRVASSDPFASVAVGSTGVGSASAKVITADDTREASVSFTIQSRSQHDLDAVVVSAVVSDAGELQVSVAFPEHPEPNANTHARLVIALPYTEIDNLKVSGGSGSFELDGPNVKQDVNVVIGSGSIRISSPLTSKDIALKTGSGSIKAAQPITAETFRAHSSSGSVGLESTLTAHTATLDSGSGSVRVSSLERYSVATLESRSGSVRASLVPGEESAQASLTSGSGSVNADMTGFHGHYIATTGSGSIRISGADNKPSALFSKKEGFVGGPDGKGLFRAKTGSGSIGINFL
ncbi:hypothetical protein BC830DRAFT_1093676 [Chytriomyces sp. MP71]|nr:hypothetical protein BC830DRAFT_1093676 [Chytriomyces sp. MP71]